MSLFGSLTDLDFLSDDARLLTPTNSRTYLVVEDDFSIQPVWQGIIQRVDPTATIRWATSAEGAARLIEARQHVNETFDFIIADIMLSGEATGVDLWKRYHETQTLFLFSSGLSVKKFADLIGEQKDRHSFLVRKPLDPLECIANVKAMLAFQLTTR